MTVERDPRALRAPDLRRRRILQGTLAAGVAGWTGIASASPASYPSKPLKLLMPSPPGSTFDSIGRAASIEAEKILDQPVIIEYRSGAGGTPSFVQAKNSAPDGYTLVILSLSTLRQPILEDVAYDALKDFIYIASLAEINFGVLVPADSPYRSWAELLAFGRAHPDKVSYGCPSGLGNSAHIFMAEVAAKEKLGWTPVPYRASSDCMTGLLSGQLTFSVDTLISAAPQERGGKVRLLAMATNKRLEAWPSIPTMRELGYATSIESPIGVGGPVGMDPQVVRKVQDAYHYATQQPSFINMLAKSDSRPWYMDAQEFTQFARRAENEQRELLVKYGLAKKRAST